MGQVAPVAAQFGDNIFRAFVKPELSGEKTKSSIETRISYKTTLKKLLFFQKTPELASSVKTNKKKLNPKLPEEILSIEEITSMIQASASARNRAFISSIYEAGARIAEIGALKMNHIVCDEYGIKLTVDGKTGMRANINEIGFSLFCNIYFTPLRSEWQYYI